MSLDKGFETNTLAASFNNASGEKPAHTGFFPSSFENNRLPWEPDRVVSVRLTDGTLAQMIQKGTDPMAWSRTPPRDVDFGHNRMDNPVPPSLKKL